MWVIRNNKKHPYKYAIWGPYMDGRDVGLALYESKAACDSIARGVRWAKPMELGEARLIRLLEEYVIEERWKMVWLFSDDPKAPKVAVSASDLLKSVRLHGGNPFDLVRKGVKPGQSSVVSDGLKMP